MACQITTIKLTDDEVQEAVADYLEKKYGARFETQTNTIKARQFSTDTVVEIDTIEIEVQEEELVDINPDEDEVGAPRARKTGFGADIVDHTLDALDGLGKGKHPSRVAP